MFADDEFLHISVGMVGLSDPQLSQGRRRMLDLVNRLHSTGVQVDIDIPQIAVIGQQSAGKSSLIEAISGITLPRSAGTCTRCPTECRLLSSQSPWQCVVALRFITDSKGHPLGQVRNEQFGPIIYNKSEVEERIRQAQRAILNPSKPSQRFLEGKEESAAAAELSFSINCVSLQISGPDLADLSFCDLPGLISSVSSGSKGGGNSISFIENLVSSYIKKPSCIILLTVACETDFENQGAHRLTKQYDPDGKRTIGVLTKPDRIPIGEVSNWLPFIRNEKEPLENGWYCVKQPSSRAITTGITWAQARKEEQIFFAGWSDELDAVYHKYLTTSNLVERLSLILSDLISKRLPEIYEELEKSIVVTRGLLNALPKAPSSDPLNEICTLIHSFTIDLARHVEGVPDYFGLLQTIRPLQEKFRRAIRMTAPNFRPFESSLKETRHLGRASFLENEENEDNVGEASDNEDDSEGQVGSLVKKSNKLQELAISRKIYIDEVMEKAQQARTRELPGTYPFVVQKAFIDDFIKHWRTPSMNLCKVVHTVLYEHVKKLVHKHFGAFGQGLLEQRVRAIINQHITLCLERTQERITWLLKLEEKPFTLNTHYLADYKAKFLAHYKGSREQLENIDLIKNIDAHNSPPALPHPIIFSSTNSAPAPQPALSFFQPSVKTALASLAAIGLPGVKAEDLPKLLPPDRMEPALIIMADVRAYFQVAYKRFADCVPLAIDLELVQGVEQNILSTLYSNLGINGQDGTRICKELAQESPQIADRRADLLKRLERLQLASDELLHVGS